MVYMQKAQEYLGVAKMRALFEQAFTEILVPRDIIEIGLHFALLERKLGEIDRARAIYMYIAEYCDPRIAEQQTFWESWYEFEVYHGNEDSYSDMMRIKRTVQTVYAGAGPLLFDTDT